MSGVKGPEPGNFVYILRCSDGTYYCGWTNDIDRRLAAHNSGHGAKYTRGRGPVELIYLESYGTESEALKREYAVKQLSRKKKEELINAGNEHTVRR